MRNRKLVAAVVALVAASAAGAAAVAVAVATPGTARSTGLWRLYDRALVGARYIDLTHEITPGIPVWKGFGPGKFSATVNPETGNRTPSGTAVSRAALS